MGGFLDKREYRMAQEDRSLGYIQGARLEKEDRGRCLFGALETCADERKIQVPACMGF